VSVRRKEVGKLFQSPWLATVKLRSPNSHTMVVVLHRQQVLFVLSFLNTGVYQFALIKKSTCTDSLPLYTWYLSSASRQREFWLNLTLRPRYILFICSFWLHTITVAYHSFCTFCTTRHCLNVFSGPVFAVLIYRGTALYYRACK